MALAQIGPLTELMQSVAAGVGAAMLLGGFMTGVVGLVRAWPRGQIDERVAEFSYIGGTGGILVILVDITLRHVI